MNKRKVTLLALVLVIALALTALTGCGNGNTQEQPTGSPDRQTSEQSPQASEEQEQTSSLPTEDRAGNAIAVPESIEKIVSLAPATTQVLESLGLKDKLVGVDTQTPLYVEGVDALPQFDMMAPDAEAIIALEPDIVFVSGISMVEGDDPFKAVKDVGICVAEIPSSESIEGVQEDIAFLANCCGQGTKGQEIIDQMQQDIDEIAAIGDTITEKKTVLFEISALPSIYSFGDGVFLDEMLEILGAENVFADQQSWISVTEESAIAANPDVILTSVNYIDDPAGEILGRTGWENVTAVKNKEVYVIDNGASSLPNQHIVDALKQMAKAIYPEQYAQIEDPFAE